jgi:3-methyl-2-oxobutanoate hydroxymethyltransferase
MVDAKHVRVQHIRQAKRSGEKISMLTAYGRAEASVFDEAGIDILLVGDSVGNNVLAHPSTLEVSLTEMEIATRAVARSSSRALVLADLPFGTYESSPELAFASAVILMKAGAAAVKFEGGRRVAQQVKLLVDNGIPVCGHLGFTPQSINTIGGHRVQGRGDAAEQSLLKDALALQEAGAFAVVLELVQADVAERVSKALDVPTIGIGSGAGTDGQVLVWHDMAGFNDWVPSFVKKFGDVRGALREAAMAYGQAVRDGSYPDGDHAF